MSYNVYWKDIKCHIMLHFSEQGSWDHVLLKNMWSYTAVCILYEQLLLYVYCMNIYCCMYIV